MTNSPVRRNKLNTVGVDAVHSNVSQEVIEITSDKLKLILNEHINLISARNAWQAPFGILLTIVLVLCTAEFKTIWNVPKDTWAAIFILSAFISFCWLINSLIKRPKAKSVEDLLNAAKNKT